MATGQLSKGEVKSICDGLECSPSQHDSSGYHGGAPNIGVTDKSSESVTKNRAGDHTTEFKMTDRGRPLPNFAKQFAKKAPQY